MFFAGECAEVEWVVRDREGGTRRSVVRIILVEIDLGYCKPVAIEEPNACAVHLQEVSARGRNGLECSGQISAGQRVIVGEGSQGILVLLQEPGWGCAGSFLSGATRGRWGGAGPPA